MFSKLISRFKEKKSDHPLGSDANIDALLADVPQLDPSRLLFEIDDRLDDVEGCIAEVGAEPTLHALTRLDQFARAGTDELLKRFLTVGTREYLAESAWSALDTHSGRLFRGYKSALALVAAPTKGDDKTRLAGCAARCLRAWALRKKLQRFRYRRPGQELWQEAHDLLQYLGRIDVLPQAAIAYRDEEETTPLREYLVGLYLEFVPVGNLVPQQLELADRFLRSCDSMELGLQADLLTTDCIDVTGGSGPRRYRDTDPVSPGMRYCSVLKLRAALMRFVALAKKPETSPAWLTNLPATREQVKSGILTLMTYWAPKPPQRVTDRIDQKAELRVVFGFGLARRMIAASHFARKGQMLKYEGFDIDRYFDENRFGRVAGEQPAAPAPEERPPEVSSPLDILNKLELRGDKAQMERWMQIDTSSTGIGTLAPAILPRHRIGALVCLRDTEGIDWRLGLIRRIGRDADNRPSIGVESLAGPSICAQAKPDGDETVWNKVTEGGHRWLDAILVSAEGLEIILPQGAFVAGMEIDLRSDEGPWRVRMDSLRDHGADFERIAITRLPAQP